MHQTLTTSATSPDAPSRIVVRASNEFLLAGLAEGIATYGSLRRSIILVAIIVANVEHIMRSAARTWRYAGTRDLPPDSERRPVSVLSLAQSLGQPFETTRQNVNALIKEGLVARVKGGIVVRGEVLTRDRHAAAEARILQAFWAMLAEMKALGVDFGQLDQSAARTSDLTVEADYRLTARCEPPRRLVSRVVHQYYLAAILACAEPFEGDWPAAAIFSAMMSLNTAPLARDKGAAWLYAQADTPPPDSLRRPARIAEAAARIGMNEETARRSVHRLIKGGFLEKTEDGYLTTMAYLQSPRARQAALGVMLAFARMIHDLRILGVKL